MINNSTKTYGITIYITTMKITCILAIKVLSHVTRQMAYKQEIVCNAKIIFQEIYIFMPPWRSDGL